MTTYKVLVEPIEISNLPILDPANPPQIEYTLYGRLFLPMTYSEVYLKSIRFNMVFPESNYKHVVTLPYQVHLKWYSDAVTNNHPGKIVQNTIRTLKSQTDVSLEIIKSNVKSTERADYSTFCQPSFVYVSHEPNTQNLVYNDVQLWYAYNLERDALIKSGECSHLEFDLFFTGLDGQRIYTHIPPVEIEFTLY